MCGMFQHDVNSKIDIAFVLSGRRLIHCMYLNKKEQEYSGDVEILWERKKA